MYLWCDVRSKNLPNFENYQIKQENLEKNVILKCTEKKGLLLSFKKYLIVILALSTNKHSNLNLKGISLFT